MGNKQKLNDDIQKNKIKTIFSRARSGKRCQDIQNLQTLSTKKRKIRMAKNVAITFEDQDTLEKTTSAIAIPIANIKS